MRLCCHCSILVFAGASYGRSARFQGDGFVELSAELRNYNSHEISLKIATTSDDGVVYWHGQDPTVYGGGKDFVAIAVVDGYLQFRCVPACTCTLAQLP